MGFLIFLIIAGGLGFIGWAIYTNKKNETYSVPDTFVINRKPTMPLGTQTSFFLTRTKELTNKNFEKIGELCFHRVCMLYSASRVVTPAKTHYFREGDL